MGEGSLMLIVVLFLGGEGAFFMREAASMFFLFFVLEVGLFVVIIIKRWRHVIRIIILLEFFRVSAFFICTLLCLHNFSTLLLFCTCVLIVCEARLGMGLIIRLTRARGDERALI